MTTISSQGESLEVLELGWKFGYETQLGDKVSPSEEAYAQFIVVFFSRNEWGDFATGFEIERF